MPNGSVQRQANENVAEKEALGKPSLRSERKLRMKKTKTICAVLALLLSFTAIAMLPEAVHAESADEYFSVAQGIINWKKSDVGATPDEYLINDEFLKSAGSTPGDWFPIGLGRLGITDNQSGYLAVIHDNVTKRYQTPKKLSEAKATEWHRISLAILASGGNPRKAGIDGNIDLIADGTYNRAENGTGILGRQGINGYIWGLITLDSLNYEVPKNAFYTRDDIILAILKQQLADGGFALDGRVSDADMTAMAMQSLAPYYNSEKIYEYTDKKGNAVKKRVRDVVDECITWLSAEQCEDGDFQSWGTANVESTVQVVVALASLGIDAQTDARFIKTAADGTKKTLFDGMLKYRTASGGFTHSFVNDPDNPSAVAGKPNTMASEQTLYGMAALWRQKNGMRALYDFRPEQSIEVKAKIAAVSAQIDALREDSPSSEVQAAYDAYWDVTPSERRYVGNYAKLAELMVIAGVEFYEEKMDYNSGTDDTPTEFFDRDDQAAADALPKVLTTQNRAEVLRLYVKIKNSVYFEGKQAYVIKLEKAKNEIDAILKEIDDLKAKIANELYPFQNIGLSKKGTVYEIYDRYMALSEYDRSAFEKSDVEGIMKCKTQVDNLQTALIITACCVVAAAVVTTWIVLHVLKRRKLKRAKFMPESDE